MSWNPVSWIVFRAMIPFLKKDRSKSLCWINSLRLLNIWAFSGEWIRCVIASSLKNYGTLKKRHGRFGRMTMKTCDFLIIGGGIIGISIALELKKRFPESK